MEHILVKHEIMASSTVPDEYADNIQKVLLLYGGQSGEHAVSLCSAKSVFDVLKAHGWQVTCVCCSEAGDWLVNTSTISHDSPLGPALSVEGDVVDLSLGFLRQFDVVLPIMHGPLYEDGCLQGLLTLAGVPFVGCGVCGSSVSMDKSIAKLLVKAAGVDVAPSITLDSSQPLPQRQQKLTIFSEQYGLPLFVKPARLGSSVGVVRVSDASELEQALDDAFIFDTKVLVEKAVVGREVEVALLQQGTQVEASVAGEIKTRGVDNFYSYRAKYLDESAVSLVMPAEFDDAQLSELQALAKRCFIALDCQGMARADFFYQPEEGRFCFNEINTIPGFTTISMYPALWQLSGIDYGSLLTKLISQACWVHQRQQNLRRQY